MVRQHTVGFGIFMGLIGLGLAMSSQATAQAPRRQPTPIPALRDFTGGPSRSSGDVPHHRSESVRCDRQWRLGGNIRAGEAREGRQGRVVRDGRTARAGFLQLCV